MPTETSGKALSKAAIVDKALDLMEQSGLAAVSLRRIATELGVSAPTLYWYIANKRELLDAVAEHLLRRGAAGVATRPAEGQPWWEWLRERARTMFEAMVSVRDAPQVVAGNRPTPDALADIDTALGELVAVGFSAAEAQEAFFALGAYIGGAALEWQSEAVRELDGTDNPELRWAAQDDERYPHLAAALGGRARHDPKATFEYGLDLLIRGMRSRHEELR
ncbi:TetR/AcrR family transcriptional regulator C-terminal domain-containing protein [Prauserella muralis]|uniref:Transcriptional regulator n=1 Tax=Prauserella muralis TaxID=588067 RepID=A0A2V4B897_9PSEU|nr:TetR/AcrR family transcriptional regulator C-terminal domain-containing protein [Prauserella muralis]PXY31376.1 transcriptional regulator [Prauserella muralis]TWE14298.1 TetR family transcriptional regulator [Prauserella muralis]